MSRSGYYEDDGCEDTWAHIRWRGAVASAMRGKKGQAFLKECLAALEAMPDKKLAGQTYEAEGAYCTLGVVGKQRGIDLSRFDSDYFDESYEEDFGVNSKVLREIIWENDGFTGWYDELGEWNSINMRVEKFGPPQYQAYKNRRWDSENGRWDDKEEVFYAPCEEMSYYIDNPELPYKRYEHMVEWLKKQIKETTDA